jgi:Sel1 repeat
MQCAGPKTSGAVWLIVIVALATQVIFAQTSVPSESDKLNARREQAERGDPEAEYELGRAYQNRPEPDYAEALRWYRKAAEAGNAGARITLGDMYFAGEGVTRDFAEAARWYGCPKPDEKILSSCAQGDQESLPLDVLKAFRKLKFCNVDDGFGTAIALAANGTPVYSTNCYEFPHGEDEEVLIGKVDGVWKKVGGGRGFWNCRNLLPLPTVHGGFHDVCHPNVCSPGGGKGCVPAVEEFSKGEYRSVSRTQTTSPAQ